MANSADSDQLATDLDLHCLQRQGIFGFSRTRVKKTFIFLNEPYEDYEPKCQKMCPMTCTHRRLWLSCEYTLCLSCEYTQSDQGFNLRAHVYSTVGERQLIIGTQFDTYISNLLKTCRQSYSLPFLRKHFITKTRLFKYIENFTTKKGKFSDKKIWYFS